jgi:hypothetical protein
MTEESKQQLLAERLRALATIILTRRDDLTIIETKRDTGLDFHVYIQREEKPMRLVFGVLLRGVSSPVTPEHANAILAPTLAQFQGMRKFTYPVCLFFFTVREEQAFFSWLAEPIVTSGKPKLIHRQKIDCLPLTNELLEEIVEQVISWYDAVETVLIA